ncbi:MAG: hypothetical protein AAGU74_13765 [Bacillota bacterium]
MKKAFVCILCLLLLIPLSACVTVVLPQEQATATPAPTMVSPADTLPPVPVSTATPADTGSPAPSPTPEGPKMYSSYAHLVSFDPDTGVAQFDYFDILRGDKAVEYLVENEGYTQAEAQARVDDFADSEFVEKNTSSALRAIDIDDVSLKLMWQPSGKHVPDVESVPSSAGDFRKIYKLESALLLDSYFFYIHVESDGHVSLVEQIYWA